MRDGVDEVMRISSPSKLASGTFKPQGTVVTVGDVRIGGDEVIVMAGPCSAESEPQVRAAAAAVRRAGAKILRGGRSEEHTSELQSPCKLVCRLLLEKKKTTRTAPIL